MPTEVKLIKCPICGNEVNNLVMNFEEKMFRMGEVFDYLDCSFCKAISIISPPDDLSRYYKQSGYYSVQAVSSVRQALMHIRDMTYVTAYPGAGLVRKYFPNSALETTLLATRGDSKARILDVGCGNGALLKSLTKLGMTALTGVDPLLGSDQVIGGIRLISGELSVVNGEFDVITFHHSLEHMHESKKVLSQARKLLAPNGRIVVRIPTRDSLAYLIYRENWFQIDAPRHMCLHSHRSIGVLAEGVGLKIERIHCDSRPMQFWASDLYRDGLPLSSPQARKKYERHQRRFYQVLSQFANDNNVGDQIVVQLVYA